VSLAGPGSTRLTASGHAGAIIALADETAPAAASWESQPGGASCPQLVPLTLQMSANLITSANQGTLVTEADGVHRDRARRLAQFVATLLTPAAPATTPSEDRPGR
jgi:acyl-coenzyme A thioesterase PaaI-like protein